VVFLRFHVLYLFRVTCRLWLRLHWSQKRQTQQSEQTPHKELELKNITVYVSGYNETDTTGMLSPPKVRSFSVAM